jgi:hypothetical protein
MIRLYWGHPLTTRIAGAPLFYGLRLGRWLFGRLIKPCAVAVDQRDIKPENIPVDPHVTPRDKEALLELMRVLGDSGRGKS